MNRPLTQMPTFHGGSMAPVAVMLEMFEQPILFYPWAARLGGSAMAGLFLSYAIKKMQALHDSGLDSQVEAWFEAPVDEVQGETGMTRFEQQAAKRALMHCGLLQSKHVGLPARKQYQIDLPTLMRDLEKRALGGSV
jgi:hypothetical protein